MAYVRIWIHAVWRTKGGQRLLTDRIRHRVLDHIRRNAASKEIFIDRLNGDADHVHCLMGLNADMAIAKAMQLIKGESAYWVNKEKVSPVRFQWADEYYAVSVSESDVDIVRAYIDNQELHHKRKSYGDEVKDFMKKYGFSSPASGGAGQVTAKAVGLGPPVAPTMNGGDRS